MKTKKRSYLSLAFIVITSPLLLQCASQDEVKNLHYNLRVVSNKVDNMKASTVSSIQKRQASSSNRLDSLQQEVLQLKSQVEEMAHMNRLLQEQQKENTAIINTLTQDLRKQHDEATARKLARIKEAERKAREAEIAAEKARLRRKQAEKRTSRIRTPSGGIETIRPGKSKVIKYVSTPSPSDAPQPVSAGQDTPQPTTNVVTQATAPKGDLMKQGQEAFKKKNYRKSFNLHESFIKANPGSPAAIEARFLMGESLFFRQQYNLAIMQYQKIIGKYPSHPKAATALLRQGNCFEKLSDGETAKIIYKKILTSHGSSPEANTARELLKKL